MTDWMWLVLILAALFGGTVYCGLGAIAAALEEKAMSDKHTHTSDCDWHVDQYQWECTCGFIPRKKAMDNLIAQDADLIDKLRDEDSYYRLQEKHWCIDAEELERQRLAAADRIEALEAENERLRLDVEAQEALQVSAYHAGLRAGWNFGVSDDNAGMQAAMANTDHIKELRRIREARAALGEKQ